jgi:LPXTG-motif cell wall-anchored protein
MTVDVDAPVGESITNTATVAAFGDVDAADEVGAVEGTVTTRPDPPDTGAPAPPAIPLLGGLLLLCLGLILVATSRRRRRRGPAA